LTTRFSFFIAFVLLFLIILGVGFDIHVVGWFLIFRFLKFFVTFGLLIRFLALMGSLDLLLLF